MDTRPTTAPRDKMFDEWKAWQRVVESLHGAACNIDINAEPQLAAAIVLWGEVLVTLRMGQPIRTRNAALKEAVAKWNLAVAKS